MNNKERIEGESHFEMALGGIGTKIDHNGDQSAAYHPQLWWLIGGVSYSQPLFSVAVHFFGSSLEVLQTNLVSQFGQAFLTKRETDWLITYLTNLRLSYTTHRRYSVLTLPSTRSYRVCWSSA